VNDPILRVNNLTKHYPSSTVSGINDISFSVRKGEVLAVIGESGSGKSTLLKCIYGLLKPDNGRVEWDGRRVKGPDEQLIPGHPEMKMVTQDFSLNIYAKVYDNIAAMLSNTDLNAKKAKVADIMERLHISRLKAKKIVELSGGEQQRVAMARALVCDTRVLLLDEPFSQVDTLLKNELRTDIKRLARETGVTIILVSHDPADGLFMADRLLLLKDGRCLQHDTPEQVYQHPQSAYVARMLGNAIVLDQQQAAAFGIHTACEEVVFYPEWVKIGPADRHNTCFIKDIYFKGAVSELLLEREGVMIRAWYGGDQALSSGDQAGVTINRYLTF